MKANERVSIAIETSCRTGGVAVGIGERLVRTVVFDTAGRHTTQLISRLDEILSEAALRPADIDEAYVSIGPGSFTGLRVGVTVVRTLAQVTPHMHCVAVPTAWAIAEGARELEWENLGVVLDAREASVHATVLIRRDGKIVELQPGQCLMVEDFLACAPRPLLLIGEGLAFEDISGRGVTFVDPDSQLHLPSPECVWRVGRRMAAAGLFTEYNHLLPMYARKPEALRLWENRANKGQE